MEYLSNGHQLLMQISDDYQADEDKTKTFNVYIQLIVSFFVFFTYLFLFFFSGTRIRKLSRFSMNSKAIKSFYYLQFIYFGLIIVFAIIIMSLILANLSGYNDGEMPENWVLTCMFVYFTFIPQTIYLILLLILFWQMAVAFYISHIAFSNDLISTINRNKVKIFLGNKLIIPVISTVSVISVLFLCLFTSTAITQIPLGYCYLGETTVTLLFVLISTLILSVRYSGSPFKSEQHKINLGKIRLITIIWAITKALSSIFALIEQYLLDWDLFKSRESLRIILISAIMIIATIGLGTLPNILVLFKGFMCVFCEQDQHRKRAFLNLTERSNATHRGSLVTQDPLMDKSFTTINGDTTTIPTDETGFNPPTIRTRHSSVSGPREREHFEKKKSILHTSKDPIELIMESIQPYIIDVKLIKINTEYASTKKKGFGKLFHAEYNNNEYLCRVIEFTRVTNYVIEDFFRDFHLYKGMCNEEEICFMPIEGVCFANPKIYVLMPHYKYTLYDVLHEEESERISTLPKCSLSKWELIMGVANIILYLNSYEPSLVHGHLSPKNIFIEDNKFILGDLGFAGLKKFAGVFIHYRNKTSWIAPEHLGDSSPTVTNPLPSADVYAFGFILWEILTNHVPFHVSETALKEYVLEGDLRPQIPDQVESNLAHLIRTCWQKEPNKRPNFDVVYDTLIRLRNTDSASSLQTHSTE